MKQQQSKTPHPEQTVQGNMNRPVTFSAQEQSGTGQRNEEKDKDSDSSHIYTTDGSTLQTPEEHEHDQSVDPRKNNRISISQDDLHETKGDRMAGSDRAGTAERKP